MADPVRGFGNWRGVGVERPPPSIRLVGLIDTRMTRNFMQ